MHPAGGSISFATLSPTSLTAAGFGSSGVLAVIAVLGFVGFEQAPVLAEEARNARRTIPVATYLALSMIAIVYAGASWAMAVHVGQSHVAAVAGQEGPGLLFGLGGQGLSQAAQFLFLTSLFAAALAFHNCVWRYMYALGREGVLPGILARTGGNNIPKAASLAQSTTGLVVLVVYALAGWRPMTQLFFWFGTTGGFGIITLLAITALAIIVFFVRHEDNNEGLWQRAIAPGTALVLLTGIVVLAVQHYNLLLGVSFGSIAAWALPATYAAVALIGLGWGLILRFRRPSTYATIGLGAHAVTGQLTPAGQGHIIMTFDSLNARRNVVSAQAADVGTLSQVIADAFHDLAPSRWLIEDQASRRAIFPEYFRLFVEHALVSGVVHTTPDRSAVALWLPVGAGGSDAPAW